MASGQFSAMLGYLHRFLRPAYRAETSDGKLLERFVATKDEAAFETLVRRHAAMVLGVCRRVLGDAHDVEDAFQATFLVLVRRASAIRKRDSVASWLHGVAYRTALKARGAAARRRECERQAEAMATNDPSVDVMWRDIRPILDEELDRLPAKYRAAFVLCYLQGKTNEQAALELGCPKGTVLSRLSRARERLRSRLARRGLTLSAGALTAMQAESTSAAATAGLVAATVKAGTLILAGSATAGISPAVVVLMKGVLASMSFTRLRVTVTLLLCIGVIGGIAYLLTNSQATESRAGAERAAARPGRASPQTEAQPAERPQDDTVPITVSGKATDRGGKPIKGAKIHLLSVNTAERHLATTTSDDQGRYEFKDAKLPVRTFPHASSQGTLQVYGTAPGFGFAWHGMRFYIPEPRPANRNVAGEDYTLFLNEPLVMNLAFSPVTSVRGQILGEQGQPLPKVRIHLGNCDYFDTTGRENHHNHREFWGIRQLPESMTTATTDASGRFEIQGVPKDACLWARVMHPEHALLFLYIATTDKPVTEWIYRSEAIPDGRRPVHSGELNLRLLAARKVTVEVVHGKTGKPVADVSFGANNGNLPDVGSSAHGITGGDGKVVLRLPPGQYNYLADPSDDIDVIRTDGRLTVANVPSEQMLRVKLRLGCSVQIEVVDVATGKGIPDVGIWYEEEGDPRSGRPAPTSTARAGSHYTDKTGQFKALLEPQAVRWVFMTRQLTTPIEYEPVKPQREAVTLHEGETVKLRLELRKRQ
jgi:RNA polymerase sigma factor (sigma-70 family)